MKNKEIFELIDYFENSKLSELEIEEEGRKLRMKKGSQERPEQMNLSALPAAFMSSAACAPPAAVQNTGGREPRGCGFAERCARHKRDKAGRRRRICPLPDSGSIL